jgi:Inner membrane component of T3SS, cytoplasmic domain
MLPVDSVVPAVSAPKDSNPSTVASQPADLLARLGAIRLDSESAPETRSLAIPEGQTIKIRVLSGASQGAEFDLSRPLMTIGRMGAGADIQVDDAEVSRLHCAIEVRREAILLQDLHSMNGTYVGDSRIFGARLENSSQFRIGSSCLQVEVAPVEMASQPKPQ